MRKKKERIVVIPKSVLDKVPEECKEEFDKVIEKLQKGENVGRKMNLIPLKKKLLCGKCGSHYISWTLDKNNKEVYYRCDTCGEHAWMYLSEYKKALKKYSHLIFE